MKSNMIKKYYRKTSWVPNFQTRTFNKQVTAEGLVVGTVDYVTGEVVIGFSKRVNNGLLYDEYSRAQANYIAFGRYYVGKMVANISDPDSLQELSKQIPAKLQDTFWWVVKVMSIRYDRHNSKATVGTN